LEYEDVEEQQFSSTSYNSKSINIICPQKRTLFNVDQRDKSKNIPPQESVEVIHNIRAIENVSQNHTNKSINDDLAMNKSVNIPCNNCNAIDTADTPEHQCCAKRSSKCRRYIIINWYNRLVIPIITLGKYFPSFSNIEMQK